MTAPFFGGGMRQDPPVISYLSPTFFHEGVAAVVAKNPLRAVAADEKAPKSPPAKPKTVSQAASSGTTRELLVAMRDRVAKDVENENTASRDLASLTKRLMELVRDIEAFDARADEEGASDVEVEDGTFNASAV